MPNSDKPGTAGARPTRVAIATSGTSLTDPVDSRFGRAPAFIIYDLDTDSFTLADNVQSLNAAQGAGIQSAETVARLGVGAVLTGHCGPKAFRVLQAANIRVFTATAGTVGEALAAYRAGELTEAAGADVDGHWL